MPTVLPAENNIITFIIVITLVEIHIVIDTELKIFGIANLYETCW